MPRWIDWNKTKQAYEYKVHSVRDPDETEDKLNEMAQQWYELDYTIVLQEASLIYLVFRRYIDD